MSGLGKSTFFVAATGDARIDGILYTRAWGGNTLTYSAPTSSFDYGTGYGSNEHLGLQQPTTLLIAAQQRYLDTQPGTAADDGFALEGFTDVAVVPTIQTNATLRIALTDRDPFDYGTAWGYFPSTVRNAGDVWLSDVIYDYSAPQVGNYENITVVHELGHTLGLEHAHDGSVYGTVPAAYDAMEYTVMTYRSYVGASTSRYSNETWGYAQSFMMLDIAALQHMYGADFSTNSGATTYSWDPANGDTLVNGGVGLSPGGNRIFATIWDGGGTDTYDLSAYATDLSIDLEPGASSVFESAQLARLGSGQYASGNIYNALLYQGDLRSLIENAIGGDGDDLLSGNQADNRLEGGLGWDTLSGKGGDDLLYGQKGRDMLLGGGGDDNLLAGVGKDTLKGGLGEDRLFGSSGDDTLRGGGSDDDLFGGRNDDRLIGGSGADQLTGGLGADVFEFRAVEHSPHAGAWDTIRDFERGLDRIDLDPLSATPFVFVGTSGFSGTGPEIRIQQVGNSDMRVVADVDGDGQADLRIELTGVTTLSSGDFIL